MAPTAPTLLTTRVKTSPCQFVTLGGPLVHFSKSTTNLYGGAFAKNDSSGIYTKPTPAFLSGAKRNTING